MFPSKLYLGKWQHAKDGEMITTLGITHILNISDSCENYLEDTHRKCGLFLASESVVFLSFLMSSYQSLIFCAYMNLCDSKSDLFAVGRRRRARQANSKCVRADLRLHPQQHGAFWRRGSQSGRC